MQEGGVLTAPVDATSTLVPAPPVAPPTRQRGLDGLRGLAVIAVLLFHQGFGWARGGYLGVSLFFTLSGFLIARLLIDEVEGTGGLRLGAFWGRRLRRLAPAALLTVLLVCVYGALFATESQLLALRGDLWSSLANVTNWRFVSSHNSYADLFQDPSPVQHFWSLAIEEQFYLVFPLLVAGIAALVVKRGGGARFRRSLGVVAIALITASLVEQVAFSSVDRIYYGTDTRALELLAGVLLACCLTPKLMQSRTMARVAGVVGVVGLAVVFVFWSSTGFGSPWLFDGGLALVALTSVVVIIAATVPGPVRAIGSWKPLVAVGLISYGLYLYHWPVFLALDSSRTGLEGWALFAVRCAVTGALAVASYHLLELPFRKGAIGRVRLAPMMWIAGLAAVAVAVPLVVPPADQGRLITAATFRHADDLIAKQRRHSESTPTPTPTAAATIFGADASSAATAPATTAAVAATPTGPLKVYVVGDSTGKMFAGGLAIYAEQTGAVEMRSSALEGCPMTDVDRVKWYKAEGLVDVSVSPDCAVLSSRWAADLTGWRPDMIVVVAGPVNVAPAHPVGAPDDEFLSPSDPAGRAMLVRGMTGYSSRLQSLAPGVPQLWLTSPYILRDGRAPSGAADAPNGPQVRAFTDVYNQIITQLAATRSLVAAVPWADYFNAKPVSADADERPDGLHVPPEREAQILDDWFPKLEAIRTSVVKTTSLP